MKPKTKLTMNPIHPALQRSYGFTMRSLVMAAVAILALLVIAVMSSCSTFTVPKVLPFDLGIRYQVEPGLYVVATPKDKGGLEVKFEGTGAVGDHLVFDGTAWTYTSPRTGIVYRISEGANGRPKIEIVGGGNGKLQLVPTTPPESNPVLTEPVKKEAEAPPAATPVQT